ncbi:MAG: alpha-E domain-containing protein [Gammaproteobacteria bacterium]|nr:alpha-E domain-containing protein [Gammaproteobacteria bacterium]NNJ83849.1 alpha-E domain-containing protein [Gammaproteobacteria bacterium]
MLSRVAERIYWMARYIERAENTARLVNTYNFLLLDLPRGTQVGWGLLPVISGGFGLFAERYYRHDERNTVKFLLADLKNPGSLVNSIGFARENSRTSREVLPEQAWEQINELKHYVDANVQNAIPRRGRFEFLTEIIGRCQQLTGLLDGTMSRDHGYHLVCIGHYLERADMTSRVVDIGNTRLLNGNKPDSVDKHIWISVLRALDAYQMYRKDVHLGVRYIDVVDFLLQNAYFPRSVAHCLDGAEELIGMLPRHKECLKAIRDVRRGVGYIGGVGYGKLKNLDDIFLHHAIDGIQLGINEVHRQIHATWFA